MSESLWQLSAEELLTRTASRAPTPGGGAIAAVCAAFGFALLEMAVAVSLDGASATTAGAGSDRLSVARDEAAQLRASAVAAADGDVTDFDALMAGYRMPAGDEAERAQRRLAIDAATVTATEGPLALAEAALAGIALADTIEPLVKASITSDVQAGRDVLSGAARAALVTADINLAALENGGHATAPGLRARRDALGVTLTPPSGRRA